MARGKAAEIGDRNVAKNGYHYIRTSTGWRLEHHVIAEHALNRSIDTETERVYFKDNNRDNLDPSNIGVKPKGQTSLGQRRARLAARVEELTTELRELDELILAEESSA